MFVQKQYRKISTLVTRGVGGGISTVLVRGQGRGFGFRLISVAFLSALWRCGRLVRAAVWWLVFGVFDCIRLLLREGIEVGFD
jgi:hypothetical protein